MMRHTATKNLRIFFSCAQKILRKIFRDDFSPRDEKISSHFIELIFSRRVRCNFCCNCATKLFYRIKNNHLANLYCNQSWKIEVKYE